MIGFDIVSLSFCCKAAPATWREGPCQAHSGTSLWIRGWKCVPPHIRSPLFFSLRVRRHPHHVGPVVVDDAALALGDRDAGASGTFDCECKGAGGLKNNHPKQNKSQNKNKKIGRLRPGKLVDAVGPFGAG